MAMLNNQMVKLKNIEISRKTWEGGWNFIIWNIELTRIKQKFYHGDFLKPKNLGRLLEQVTKDWHVAFAIYVLLVNSTFWAHSFDQILVFLVLCILESSYFLGIMHVLYWEQSSQLTIMFSWYYSMHIRII